jgi:acyl-coenzyme A thioesterase PaaI-like protein
MIRVEIRVNNDRETLLLAVRAGSIEQAIGHVKERYAEYDARVVFPLDPENFFAGDARVGGCVMALDVSEPG